MASLVRSCRYEPLKDILDCAAADSCTQHNVMSHGISRSVEELFVSENFTFLAQPMREYLDQDHIQGADPVTAFAVENPGFPFQPDIVRMHAPPYQFRQVYRPMADLNDSYLSHISKNDVMPAKAGRGSPRTPGVYTPPYTGSTFEVVELLSFSFDDPGARHFG